MSLYLIVNGNQSTATDVNQIIDVLQQPSGGQETGQYYLQGGAGGSGWTVSNWIVSLSRNATPASVSINTSTQSPAANAGTPSTPILYTSGFQVTFLTTGSTNTARAGGGWTIQF